MINPDNPFPVTEYLGPDLFCDREAETKLLISNARNGVNSTLLSIRRMGKTGLIRHVFHEIEKAGDRRCIYVDIYGTRNFKDFTNQFATAVLKAFPEKQSVGKKLLNFIKGFRPLISFDALTGDPEVSFDFSQPRQFEHSFTSLLSFLEKQRTRIVIAIDEFQQVSSYPEKNTEALLRTHIQPLKNIRFIFSGSNEHILTEMFNQAKRPFFASTQSVHLGPIDPAKYTEFIERVMAKHKRRISSDATEFILEWTRLHTYYTQAVCNKVFADGTKAVTLEAAQRCCRQLLNEQENTFFQYRNLLTTLQWDLLNAIAKEDRVYKPTSKGFIKRHDVGTTANVQRALQALMQKEMIYKGRDEQGSYYCVYDCFLARWLA